MQLTVKGFLQQVGLFLQNFVDYKISCFSFKLNECLVSKNYLELYNGTKLLSENI